VLFINLLALIVEGVIQINDMYVLLVCRSFQGIFSGAFMALIPIYIYELAPRQLLGSYGVFTQLMVVVALVFSYGLGLILSIAKIEPFLFYRIMVSTNGLFVIVQSVLLLINFIPESPNSLIMVNKHDEAKRVLAMFTKDEYVH
jgi:MFS family permease